MEIITSVTIVTALNFDTEETGKGARYGSNAGGPGSGGTEVGGRGTQPPGICVTVNIDLAKPHMKELVEKLRCPLDAQLGVELDDVKHAIIAALNSYLKLFGKLSADDCGSIAGSTPP